MAYPVKRINFGGSKFDVYAEVYEPAEDSFLFADNLDVKVGDFVLDVGTGCGILSVLASKRANRVVSVDINPFAIRCARENAKRNEASDKIDFIWADLLTPFSPSVKFDLILFNAPYLPSEKMEGSFWIELSWAGGKSGREVMDRFISQAPLHLKVGGRILMMQSTLTSVELTLKRFNQVGLKAKIKAAKKLPFFETLTLIEVSV